jgi:alkylation response protein AidB-like acyl-CoA dehydrogenase
MDFSISEELANERDRYQSFLNEHLRPHLSEWFQKGEIPRTIHETIAQGGWSDFETKGGKLVKRSALRSVALGEALAAMAPGLAVALLAHEHLGVTGLWLFGSPDLQQAYADAALRGETLICLGNTESGAGSDVANIVMRAQKVKDGWVLNGTKAYVTNGAISDMAVVTAVSDPDAPRNNRLSMFLVDLRAKGVTRKKLNKQVWIPSDLTRIGFNDVFVADDHLVGRKGQGLQQVLTIFTYSRVPISALALGTAAGAFDMAARHAMKREVLGKRIAEHQAKSFEMADFHARMEAARMMVWKACWAMDQRADFRAEASLAKYLTVQIAREVTAWAADVFGAASVIYDHPVHKFPMDAWAASLGEGTQDVQKLIIFRELLKQYGE